MNEYRAARQSATTVRYFRVLNFEAPAAAKNTLVGKGNGTAVETASAVVPQLSKSLRSAGTRPLLNLLCTQATPARRARLNVRYAPITDPVVARAAYQYHGSRCRAARI